MFSLLAVVTLLLGQADSAFKTFLDMDTVWSGKITIDGNDVVVQRLEVTPTKVCSICNVSALRFAFQFDGDFRLPTVADTDTPLLGDNTRLGDCLRAIEPGAFRVQSKYHGDKGVPACSGSELVLKAWNPRSDKDNASVCDFTLDFWKCNTLGNRVELKGRVTIKGRHLEGSISGNGMPPVKFAFMPIPKDKDKSAKKE